MTAAGPDPAPGPEFAALLEDLNTLRREGILKLRRLRLPALAQAARALNYVDDGQVVDAPVLENLLRATIDELGPGQMAEAASKLYGLEPGYREQTPKQNREAATEVYFVKLTRFRQHYQKLILGQLAEVMLRLIREHELRLSYLRMTRRTPVSTRLAVQWIERFSVYYRLWSPVAGLGADLTAYRSTLFEPNRPYDRAPDPDDAQDNGYSQEIQAMGYGTYAWHHLAEFLLLLQQFTRRYGGHWVLSDGQAEHDITDAVYRIGHVSPWNERDDSVLRLMRLIDEAEHELHPFLLSAAGQPMAMEMHAEWQDWLAACQCSWPLGERLGREPFPTHRQFPTIDARCPVHRMITACADYMLILDDDWARIADWYHVPHRPRPGLTGERLYVGDL